MTDVRETLGPAGYGATWLLLERIGESWDGKTKPELRISAKEWKKTYGISAKKLQELLDILKNHGIIFAENDQNKLRMTAPILLDLLDEWTSRNRKNSGGTPEQLPSSSRATPAYKQNNNQKYIKNKTRHPPAQIRARTLCPC